MVARAKTWRLCIDTGGTFTDCLAVDPQGGRRRAKILSSSTFRARVRQARAPRRLTFAASWQAPIDFLRGGRLRWLQRDEPPLAVVGSRSDELLTAEELPLDLQPGERFEVAFEEEAPVLAARWLTGTAGGCALPPIDLRLATTRGTNALLQRRGAPTALFITRGFADLLRIGSQQRPDLFALDIVRPAPLYSAVVEVDERLAADGSVVRALDLESLGARSAELLDAGLTSAAVALLHSYRNPAHEERLSEHLRALGWPQVSASAALSPTVKILPRAETAVVDAFLAPIVGDYLRQVGAAVNGQLQVMTSAGGLSRTDTFRACDSLLSGPAGGVVGAAACGIANGYRRLLAFDMGGTSTDVSRFDGDFEYRFEHQVGDARVAAPALYIETVAAGGGSVCWLDGQQLKVGPQSAGADPGPACYGAGGPLTLTDVNLLLGRLALERFPIPVEPLAARQALDPLLESCSGEPVPKMAAERVLAGLLEIANERMADAIRQVSVGRGFDPRQHALVAFGGAGGQHACALAELLAIERVLLPAEAGLLSALGLGEARLERFAHRQVLRPLAEVENELPGLLAELDQQARAEVVAAGVAAERVSVRRRLGLLRLLGQESTLEIELGPLATGGEPAVEFAQAYQQIYGYPPPRRPIEVESLRVVASEIAPPTGPCPEPPAAVQQMAKTSGSQRVFVAGAWRSVATFWRPDLQIGEWLDGPAMVFEPHATLLVENGWRARVSGDCTLVLENHAVLELGKTAR